MFRAGSAPTVTCAFVAAVVLASIALTACSAPVGGTLSQPSSSSSANSQSSGWQEYANTDGDSSVRAYEDGADYIRVRFSDGSVYLYTYASAGQANIERMKQLARAGTGLNSFIMSNVRKKYESKQ